MGSKNVIIILYIICDILHCVVDHCYRSKKLTSVFLELLVLG